MQIYGSVVGLMDSGGKIGIGEPCLNSALNSLHLFRANVVEKGMDLFLPVS